MAVGSVLVVPFGRRRVLGLVVDMVARSELPPERLVEPLECLEAGVPPELVRLGLWVADQYCSTPARGLALVLPPGTGTSGSGPGAVTRELLVAGLTEAGRAALAPGAGRLGVRQRAALERLEGGSLSAAALSRSDGIAHATLRRLADRGLVHLGKEAAPRRPGGLDRGKRAGASPAGCLPRLTELQEAALREVAEPLTAGRHEKLLLHGVTSSGKTEVYLEAAGIALDRGRSAIVLVPEIALTPQTMRRFEERFGERVAVLHSKLGLGERYDEWQRLRCGEARICVGPRSAVSRRSATSG